MPKQPIFSSPFIRTLTSVVACLLVSIVITAAMPAYLPFNQGDRIAGPTLMFPFIWLALFLCRCVKRVPKYACAPSVLAGGLRRRARQHQSKLQNPALLP